MISDLNIVKEVHPGVFGATMWCPTSGLLAHLLDPGIPYVLVWNHFAGSYRWEAFDLPVVGPAAAESVLSRLVSFDFVMPTGRFLAVLPQLRAAIRAVQVRRIPPDYLDLNQIRGPERYRLLSDRGWHVLIDTPANDFGQVFSPDPELVAKAVQCHRLSA